MSAALSTRCPRCATVFRVMPAQLAARGGKVRCGKCAQVFDGVGELIEGGSAAPAEELAELEPSPQLALFEAARKSPVITAASEAANEEQPVPEFLEPPLERPRRLWLWAIASFLALATLFAQAAYYSREWLSVWIPESRAFLDAACQRLGCEVRLPRNTSLIGIESSVLRDEGTREHVIVLDASIRNRAPFPQEFPQLALSLTAVNGNVLVRRLLNPEEYLGAKAEQRIRAGMKPNSEEKFIVHFDRSSVAEAVGFEIRVFYR